MVKSGDVLAMMGHPRNILEVNRIMGRPLIESGRKTIAEHHLYFQKKLAACLHRPPETTQCVGR